MNLSDPGSIATRGRHAHAADRGTTDRGLLLRLGQPDLLNIASMAAAGDAIFSNLGLLFAIGVAVGLARENHGAAGLRRASVATLCHQGGGSADRGAAQRECWATDGAAR